MILSYEIIERESFFLNKGVHSIDSILIVLEGDFICKTNDVEHHIKANEIFFFKSNVPFYRKIISKLKAIYILVDEFPLSTNQKITTYFPNRIEENISFLKESIIKGDIKSAEHILEDVLFLYKANYIFKDSLANEIIEYFKQNYSKSIHLDDLAKKFNISKQGLIIKFKNQTGYTPIVYLNNLRFKKAQQLLLLKELNIAEIAYLCGFETSYYFSKVFKKRFGISPNKWRKNAVL